MRRRILALAGSFAFLLIAPGTVAGVVPWLITHWRWKAGHSGALAGAGVAFIVFGLTPLVESFARFAWYQNTLPGWSGFSLNSGACP